MEQIISFTSNECNRYEHADWTFLESPRLTYPDGYFSVIIPLNNLMEYLEDFKKI